MGSEMCIRDSIFADEDRSVDDLPADIESDGAGFDAAGGGVREGLIARYVDDLARLDAGMHGRGCGGGAGHDLCCRTCRFQVGPHSGDETAAANRNKYGVQVFSLFKKFHSDGPLSCDDVLVVVGGDVDQAVFLGQGPGVDLGFETIISMVFYLGSIALDQLDLRGGGVGGDTDGYRGTDPACPEGAGRSMVARSCLLYTSPSPRDS